MNEKPAHLKMTFDEALTRLARTPKTAIDVVEGKRDQKKAKPKASQSSPQSGGRKTA